MASLVLTALSSGCRELLEAPLAAAGISLLARSHGEALLDGALDLHPDAVLYEMRPDLNADLAVLQLLRRSLPQVPLVLIGGDASMGETRLLRDLRPVYIAVPPVDAEEIVDALRAALHRNGRSGLEARG